MPPQDTSTPQQPQLDPNYDWAKLPNGEYAKFKKGTSRVEIQGRLVNAGLLPKPKPPATVAAAQTPPAGTSTMSPYKIAAKQKAAQNRADVTYGGTPVPQGAAHAPYYGMTPSNVAGAFGHMALDTLKFGRDVTKDVVTRFPESVFGKDTTYERFVDRPGDVEAAKAANLMKQGRLSEAIGHGTAAVLPGIGPVASQLGEQAGRGDIGGALGAAAGMYATGRAVEGAGELAYDKVSGMVTPESLRTRAAKLNTKVLQTAKAGTKGYSTAVGLQVAKEGIISNLRELPNKIETVRAAKNAKVQSLVQQADAAGTTIDVTTDLQSVLNDVRDVANRRGQLDPRTVGQLQNLTQSVASQLNAQGVRVPRNLSTMKLSDALQLEKGLEDLSAFGGKKAPSVIQNFARRMRKAINDKVGAASPDVQKLRGEESKLITARDAARENYAKVLNDGRTMARGFIYSNMPAIGAYLGMKALGMPFAGAIGSVLVMRTLAESVRSRTLRAALYARAADLLDTPTARPQGPQAPPGTGMAVRPGSPGGVPTAPVNPANARLTGAAPQAAPTPTAPANVVNPPALGAATTPTGQPVPPAVARVQAQPGRTGVSPTLGQWEPPLELGPVGNVEDVGKAARDKTKEPTRAEARGEAPSTGERRKVDRDFQKAEDALFAQARWELPENATSEQVAAKVEELRKGSNVAESNTKTTKKSPEASAKNKAMLDRLDTLYERQASPKSGADRNAIEREITEIKRVLSGEAKGSEASAINKRIADRERLAAKRAEAKASTPGSSTGSATGSAAEATAPASASPENRTILLDAGYKKLTTYEGGPEMVAALKKLAADLKKVDPSYDEVTALTDALNAMREVEGK